MNYYATQHLLLSWLVDIEKDKKKHNPNAHMINRAIRKLDVIKVYHKTKNLHVSTDVHILRVLPQPMYMGKVQLTRSLPARRTGP